MVLKTSAGAPITCEDWNDLCDVDGFLGLGRNRYPFTYVIFKDATYYYAQNGTTGAIDFGGPTNEGTPAVSGTDCAAVMQAAINAINGTGNGGYIMVREGTYTLTSGLTFYAKVSMGGQGYRRAPRLNFDLDATTDCITLPSASAYLILERMRLYGVGTTRHGVYFSDTSAVVMREMTVDNMTQNGLHIDSSFSNRFYDVTCNSNGNDGIYVCETLPTVTSDNLFIGGYCRDNTQDGIELGIGLGARNTWINCLCESNGRYGAWFRSGHKDIISCNFENNTEHQCYWGGSGTILGCQFQGSVNPFYGLYISGNRTRIAGCRFNGNWNDINILNTAYDLEVGTFVGAPTLTWGVQSYDHVWMGVNEFPNQATGAPGTVALTFAHAFTAKPDVSVSLETNNVWYISAWSQDVNLRYNGCTITVTTLAGANPGAGIVVNAYVKRNG